MKISVYFAAAASAFTIGVIIYSGFFTPTQVAPPVFYRLVAQAGLLWIGSAAYALIDSGREKK